MEGLLDSSWEFILPLFLRIPQLCSDWGRKGAEITFIHPKPSLERPSSLNLGGKGTTGFDGSLFSGLPKAAKLWDQLQEQFYKRDISKELLHAQTHKAGVNKHHEHKFSVLPIFMGKFHKQAEDKLQNYKVLDICCTKGSKFHPNTLATSHST